jgi:hypothetical protein
MSPNNADIQPPQISSSACLTQELMDSFAQINGLSDMEKEKIAIPLAFPLESLITDRDSSDAQSDLELSELSDRSRSRITRLFVLS